MNEDLFDVGVPRGQITENKMLESFINEMNSNKSFTGQIYTQLK